MTAFALKLSDATFPQSKTLRGIRLPNRDKLVGEYLLGGSEAESIKNRADPSSPLTVQGVPTYNTTHAVVRSSTTAGYGFKTGIIPNDDATLILVRENAALATEPKIFGMGNGGVNILGMRQYAGPTNYFSNGENANNLGANRPLPGAGVYFEAGTLSRRNLQRSTGGYATLYWFSAGVIQSAVSASLQTGLARSVITQMCIGSDSLHDTINTNTIPVYFAAIYQRTLTAAEIEEAYDALVAYYATRGVTVT
jgi:hypothetical protein